MHKYIQILLLFISVQGFSQSAFTVMGTPYTQNFNTLVAGSDGATYPWTNNTTLTGWYVEEVAGAADDLPLVEASYNTMSNGGSIYFFRNAGDCSLGSRAAGSTNTCHYGVRIINNTGVAITSLYLDYYGEQWSIAENGANVNTNTFSYQVAASVTSLTAGSWTNVAALDFTQIWSSSQSAGLGGSACGGTSSQCLALDGNQSANRIRIQGCITVSIPAGQEIMLRWTDIDNAANDHHLQIDDVLVYPFDVSCATVLPVDWLSFTAERVGNTSLLEWETASEENNDYFSVERLNENGYYVVLGTVDGNGTTSQANQYSFTDEAPVDGTNYYRIRQVDFNGQYTYSVIRTVEFADEPAFSAYTNFDGTLHYSQVGNSGETTITVYAGDGRIVSSIRSDLSTGLLETPRASGTYYIRFENAEGIIVVKQLIIL